MERKYCCSEALTKWGARPGRQRASTEEAHGQLWEIGGYCSYLQEQAPSLQTLWTAHNI